MALDLKNILLIISITIAIILIPLSALVLKLATKWLKFKSTKYKTSLGIASILAVIKIVLVIPFFFASLETVMAYSAWVNYASQLISFILGIFLVKYFYNVNLKKSALVSLIWTAIMFIIAILITTILATIIAAVLIAVSIASTQAAI